MQQIPEGYKQDAKGNLRPLAKIHDIDLARDDLVNEIIQEAIELNQLLIDFKNHVFGNIAAFVQLSAEHYGAKIGGHKGNVTLTSYDGRYKIQRAYAETLVFDERLQAAKSLIDECIKGWSDGINDNIKVLVTGVFEVDKEGKVNTTKVLSLRQYKIDDPAWKKAMEAISDSLRVSDTKAYIRLYKRVGDTDKYEPISLDIAAV
ncbi:DUF3164 family protein [Methylophilus sp. DW102]|uniref:DUF3164 family protein n=1 Tax=Methylophilus sp. DW102 TaxID=3095607 RepID=UPI003084C3E9|nr:DUF3164 family protein [Methylophilus sp. DW102]